MSNYDIFMTVIGCIMLYLGGVIVLAVSTAVTAKVFKFFFKLVWDL